MATIITEISKYLIIFFMVLYTIKCFTVLKPVREDKKNHALNVQIVYVFIIHFLCYLTLFLKYKTISIVIFYLLQMIVSIVYMVSYHGIYKKSSRLITNNMSFLLLIGYVMLTRLDFDLAKKQFAFATACDHEMQKSEKLGYFLCNPWNRFSKYSLCSISWSIQIRLYKLDPDWIDFLAADGVCKDYICILSGKRFKQSKGI